MKHSAAGVAPAARQLYGGRARGVAEADQHLEAAPPGRLGRRFLLADEAPEVEAGAAYQQTGHVEAGHVDQVAHLGAAVPAGGEGNLAAAPDRRAIEPPD